MVDLSSDQLDLLVACVDAHLRVDSSQRGEFYWSHHIGDPRAAIHHEGLPAGMRAHYGDLEELSMRGLIRLSPRDQYSGGFRLSNTGIELAQRQSRRRAASVEAVEAEPMRYIRAEVFSDRYTEAHRKWLEADRITSATGTEAQLSTVGHLCREAMQVFATSLCAATGTPPPDSDPAHTVVRIKACIAAKRSNVGDALSEFLSALTAYWGTVNDLVQRQEHGSSKSGPPLTLEDARRIVFHTAIVMYELDRALVR